MVDAAWRISRRRTGEAWNVQTKPYAGIPELLDALAARGDPPGESSRTRGTTSPRNSSARLTWPELAISRRSLAFAKATPRKPDPTSALEIAARLGVEPACLPLRGRLGRRHADRSRNAGMFPRRRLLGLSRPSRCSDPPARAGAIIDHPPRPARASSTETRPVDPRAKIRMLPVHPTKIDPRRSLAGCMTPVLIDGTDGARSWRLSSPKRVRRGEHRRWRCSAWPS